MNQTLWLITYDIASPKRWRKVFKLLKSYGHGVQYSVFECYLSAKQKKKLLWLLEKEIDAEGDKVLCYPICGQCNRRTIVLGTGLRAAKAASVWIISDA